MPHAHGGGSSASARLLGCLSRAGGPSSFNSLVMVPVLLMTSMVFLYRVFVHDDVVRHMPKTLARMGKPRFEEVAAMQGPAAVQGDTREFDAIIVAAGGQTKDGPPPHVLLRLEQAVALYKRQPKPPLIITTARGTPHKPSPVDAAGFEVHESQMNAKWLIAHGVKPEHILEESSSLETVGNAFFTRVLHTDVLQVRRLAVINNLWHMPRTRAVFEHVFSVPPEQGYIMTFYAVGSGLADDILKRRLVKEVEALPKFSEDGSWRKQTPTLQAMHEWIHKENTAYAAKRLLVERKPLDPKLAESY